MEEKKVVKASSKLTEQHSMYKIIIPAKVEDRIRLLCSEVNTVEWSGALFYNYTGSFETNDLVIECQDICVMDIGTGGYTEFNESPEIITYQMEHNLLDCKIGLIHSHNNMPTFFSGTDKSTLNSEGSSMNNFVSLIVNNDGKYTAAITRKVKLLKDVRASKSYKFFGEKEIDLGSSQYYESEDEIQYFMLEVIKEEGMNAEILSRIAEIRKNKSKVAPTGAPYYDFRKYNYNEASPYPWSLSNSIKDTPNEKKSVKEIKKENSKQLTIFDDYCEEIPYGEVYIEAETLNAILLQILTGNVCLTKKSPQDVETWMKNCDAIYKKRFRTQDDFDYWVDANIDSIMVTTHLSNIELYAEEDEIQQALLAYDLYLILEDYKDNSKYIKIVYDKLGNYIL